MNLKLASLLLGLCQAGSAAALGLGDLTVRSHLGQPLHATIEVVGANATTDADCFSLAPSEGAAVPPPARARLSLERTGDQALLHVRTSHTINDPIAQFSVTSDCESRLRRDYVALLDPPSQKTPSSQNAPAATAHETQAVAQPLPSVTRPADTSPPKQATAASRSSTIASRKPDPTREPAVQAALAPRLVLSGKHGIPGAGLSLRFDTNLPDLNRPRTEKLTPDELSDENTALTRKLAYLESQLAGLQKRNTAIAAKRAGETAPPPLPSPGQSARWPIYLLILGLLVAATAFIVLLRRRGRSTHHAEGKTAWNASALPEIDRMTSDPWTQPRDKHPEPRSEPEPEPVIEFIPSNQDQTTEIKDDILDQAEVYMAHGHGELAVHLLQEHLREAPNESPVPWLLLLDLIHREGDTAAYTAASAECRQYFNVDLSSPPISQDSEVGRGLETYPHLLERLLAVWGSPEVDTFFEDLIFDNRGGTRIGFEPRAYRDILLLRSIARSRKQLSP